MTSEENLKLLHRAISALYAAFNGDVETLVLTPQPDGTIKPWMIVSDTFAWASADGEDITLENIDEFERAVRDVKAVSPTDIKQMNTNGSNDAGTLFASRMRKQKPLKYEGFYPTHPSVYPLIEAVA